MHQQPEEARYARNNDHTDAGMLPVGYFYPTYECVSYNPLRPGWRTPRSLHPGGVNVISCDGHVQSIKETINTVT